MRIYLAGPMRGVPEENKPAFDEAAAALRAAGHIVCVPHEYDKMHPGNTLRQNFAGTVSWMCLYAEAVATLNHWLASKGTKAEVATAEALGIPVKPWKEWL